MHSQKQFVRASVLVAAALIGSKASAATVTNTDDHYTFVVDSVTTKFEFAIDTNMGSCTFPNGSSASLTGNVYLQLHSGAGVPLGSGSCDSGDCTCVPDMVAVIPNSIPGGPNLLELDFFNLRISPTTPQFAIANGAFDTTGSFGCLGGTMVVHLLGQVPVNVPCGGLVSDSESTHGAIAIDASGIHVARQFSNRLNVDVPAVGLVVHIGVAGTIRADMSYPPAVRFCPATMNSTGLVGRIDASGTTSVTMNDCGLQFSHCPHDVFGVCFAGSSQGQVTYGNGVLCVVGTVHRLPSVHFAASGTASLALDLDSPPLSSYLVPGSTWGFQCAFRDPAAGGARLNTTDAIQLRFTP
jgi:hypothetical protein